MIRKFIEKTEKNIILDSKKQAKKKSEGNTTMEEQRNGKIFMK